VARLPKFGPRLCLNKRNTWFLPHCWSHFYFERWLIELCWGRFGAVSKPVSFFVIFAVVAWPLFVETCHVSSGSRPMLVMVLPTDGRCVLCRALMRLIRG
jgi:hypothetical protein